MDEKTAKKRGWIKNIAIIFLALMLILTLFSNTILNYSLPQISAQYCYGGVITTRIRGSAAVEAKSTYTLNSPSSATIRDVGVKNGDIVEEGMVLFLFENERNGDLASAMSELASLKEEYNALLTSGKGDYSELSAQVNAAAKSRNEAAAAKSQLTGLKSEIKAEQKTLDEKQKELVKLEARIEAAEQNSDDIGILPLDEAKAKLDDAEVSYANAKAESEAAKANLNSAQQAKREADAALKAAKEANGDSGETIQSSVSEDSLRMQMRNIEDLERAYQTAYERYQRNAAEFTGTQQSAIADMFSAQRRLEAALTAYSPVRAEVEIMLLIRDALTEALEGDSISDETRAKYLSELDSIVGSDKYALYLAAVRAEEEYTAARQASDNVTAAMPEELKAEKDALDTQYITLQRAREDYNRDYAEYSKYSMYSEYLRQITICSELLDEAQTSFSDAERICQDAKSYYDSAKTEYDAACGIDVLPELKVQLGVLEDECEKLQTELEEKNDKLSELNMIISSAMSDYEYNSLLSRLSQAMKSDSGSDEVLQIKLEVMDQRIAEKEKEIENLRNGSYTTEVVSPVSGLVSSVNVTAGSRIGMNEPLAEITIVDSGYTAEMTVTTEQAQRLKRGDRAEIQNYWWGETPTAVISSIMVDRTNPQNSRIVTLDITGDVSVGTRLTFTFGERAQSYDMVVPNMALHEDNAGKFVYCVDVKSTPLGARYTARRVDVSVIASDENQSALTGLPMGEYVILNSSKPIEQGMQVRLNES